jgi:predicted  nucleic acid-binding Zn-ribbon protein
MAARKQSNGLEAALATLIQNQAQFVSHLDENRQRFSRIEEELEAIKALLIRHERTLEQLPEAIRDKVGFKGQ